jgi:WD40 repeat protein
MNKMLGVASIVLLCAFNAITAMEQEKDSCAQETVVVKPVLPEEHVSFVPADEKHEGQSKNIPMMMQVKSLSMQELAQFVNQAANAGSETQKILHMAISLLREKFLAPDALLNFMKNPSYIDTLNLSDEVQRMLVQEIQGNVPLLSIVHTDHVQPSITDFNGSFNCDKSWSASRDESNKIIKIILTCQRTGYCQELAEQINCFQWHSLFPSYIAAASNTMVSVWNVELPDHVCTIGIEDKDQVSRKITKVAWHPTNPNVIAVQGQEDTTSNSKIYIWDINHCQNNQALEGPFCDTFAFDPLRTDRIALFYADKVIVQYIGKESSAVDAVELSYKEPYTFVGLCHTMAWHPTQENSIGLVISDNILRIWDVAHNAISCIRTEHTKAIRSLSWNPAMQHLIACASDDGMISVWDTMHKQCVMKAHVPSENGTLEGSSLSLQWDSETELTLIAGNQRKKYTWNLEHCIAFANAWYSCSLPQALLLQPFTQQDLCSEDLSCTEIKTIFETLPDIILSEISKQHNSMIISKLNQSNNYYALLDSGIKVSPYAGMLIATLVYAWEQYQKTICVLHNR